MLDLALPGYLVPPYVPLEDVSEMPDAPYLGEAVANADVTDASSVDRTVAARAADRAGLALVGVAYSDERGFDDDEAPAPDGSQVDLFE